MLAVGLVTVKSALHPKIVIFGGVEEKKGREERSYELFGHKIRFVVHHGGRWDVWGQDRGTRGGRNLIQCNGSRVRFHDDCGWRLLGLVELAVSGEVWT